MRDGGDSTTRTGRDLRVWALGAVLCAALLGAPSALAQADAPAGAPAAPPAAAQSAPPNVVSGAPNAPAGPAVGPSVRLTFYAVSGLAKAARKNCGADRAPDGAPDLAAAEGRRAFAALFGGTDAAIVGEARKMLADGRVLLEGFAAANDRPFYFGYIERRDAAEGGRAAVRLQRFKGQQPFMDRSFPLARGGVAWRASWSSDDEETCVVVRIESLDALPPPAPFGALPARWREAEPLKSLKSVMPAFPGSVRRGQAAEKVVVDGVVGLDGRMDYCQIRDYPAGGADAAMAALEAVSQWRWRPARLDGKPIPMPFAVTITFALR